MRLTSQGLLSSEIADILQATALESKAHMRRDLKKGASKFEGASFRDKPDFMSQDNPYAIDQSERAAHQHLIE